MRGFPLVSLCFAVVALAVTGIWPLRRVTTAVAPPVDVAEPADSTEGESLVPARATLRFAHAPVRAEIHQGDDCVASADGGDWSGALALSCVDGIAELRVSVTWPDGTPDTVAELRVEPDGLPARTVNVWSAEAAADEIVQFSWQEGLIP